MRTKKRSNKYIAVLGFFLSIALYNKVGEIESIFWSIYAHSMKDFFIISLLIIGLKKEESIKDIGAILTGVFYCITLFSIRLYSAANSVDYKAYMALMKSNYTSTIVFSAIVILVIILLIPMKHERRD